MPLRPPPSTRSIVQHIIENRDGVLMVCCEITWWRVLTEHGDASLTDPLQHSTHSYISSTRHRAPWHSGYWQRLAAWGRCWREWQLYVHSSLVHCSADAKPSIHSSVRNPICRRRTTASSYICVWVIRASSYTTQTIANISQRQASAVRVKQDLISCLTHFRSESVGRLPGSLMDEIR